MLVLTWVLGIATAVVGVLHFTWPEPFLRIMPPALPAPLTLVYVSGVFEIIGGLGVLFPVTRRAAAAGLLVLYAAVFPANIYMATAGINPVPEMPGTSQGRYNRLPFQAGLFLWCVALMRAPHPTEEIPVRNPDWKLVGQALVVGLLPWPFITDASLWLSTAGATACLALSVWWLWIALDVTIRPSGSSLIVRRGPRTVVWDGGSWTITKEGETAVLHRAKWKLHVKVDERVDRLFQTL